MASLNFLLGRAGKDKTNEIIKMIKGDIENNTADIILLVPEQFSFETECKLINSELGEQNAAKVTVLSFARLYNTVSREHGNIAGKRLNASDSILLMGRALNDVKDKLCCLSKFWGNKDFASLCVDTVKELKSVCANENALKAAAAGLTGKLKNKTLDLATVMESYNIKVAERFIDPCDDMDKLCEMINNYGFFKGKTVYADCFSRFTGQELRIIEKIIEQSKSFTVSLTCPNEYDGSGAFTLPLDTKNKLEALAKQNGVCVNTLPEITQSYYKNKELYALEEMLFAPEKRYDGKCENIKVVECNSQNDEADFAMYTIHNLVRKNNMRFKDFAIIVRNIADYEQAIIRASKKYGVPCFADSKISCGTMPLMIMAKNAFGAAISLDTQKILAYIKTGLAGMDANEVCELENYVYVWNIKGAKWREEWDMNPAGLQNEKFDINEIDRINELRKKAVLPIMRLEQALKTNNTKQMLTGLWQLTVDCDTAKSMQELTERLDKDGYAKEAELNRQSHKMFIGILDHLLYCMGNTCDKKELYTAFCLACDGEKMAAVPQTMDEVAFGSADRIVCDMPKVVFALGLNGSEWPKNLPTGGILSQNDRKQLSQNGIHIPGLIDEFTAVENHMCYTALCSPNEKLFVTYHKAGAEPSYIANAVITTFGLENGIEKWPKKINSAEQIESDKMAFSVFAENSESNTPISAALAKYLNQSEKWQGVISAAQSANIAVNGQLNENTTKAIKQDIKHKNKASAQKPNGTALDFDENEVKIPMSATASDMFNKCRFAYFCKYIARARVAQKADLNAMQKGTIVHFVLEKTVLELRNDFSFADDETVLNTVEKYWQVYINGVNGLAESIDGKMDYMFKSVKEQCKAVALRLRDEFAQSEFIPKDCELGINESGEKNSIAPIKFKNGDITLVSNGKVDRVDVDTNNEYVRIVDYKTGDKSFAPKDILVGQDLQMLLYLYNILQSKKYGDVKPAGVLYMPASLSREENNTKAMNGVLLENEDVVKKMEKNNEGMYVPRLVYKQKKSPDDSNELQKNKNTYIKPYDFELIFNKITKIMEKMAGDIDKGDFSVSPTDGSHNACEYCDYKAVCGFENGEHFTHASGASSMSDVLNAISEEEA